MSNRMLKSMLSVSGVIIVAKLLGFVRQIITATTFGSTIETDLIMLGQGIIQDLDFVCAQTLITSFIPIYISEKRKGSAEEHNFVSAIIKILFAVSLVIVVILVFGAPLFARILAPAYSKDLSDELAYYIRIFAPTFILIAETGVFNALLKANKYFVSGELLGVYQSVSFILCVLLFSGCLKIDSLNLAFYLYVFISFMILCVSSRKWKLWSITKGTPVYDHSVKRFLKTTLVVLFGYSMVFVNQQIDKMIASGMGEGVVTSVHYAAVLNNFVCALVASTGGILFTYVTNEIMVKNDAGAAELIRGFSKLFIWLLIPISVLTWIYSEDIVRIVFGRGEFDSNAVISCSTALKGYSLGFVPYVVRELYGRVLYAYEDSKHATINSSVSIAINIVLSIILSRFWGILGITIASSISVVCCGILNLLYSHVKNRNIDLTVIAKEFSLCILGILFFILITIGIKRMLPDVSTIIRLMATAVINISVSVGLMNKQIRKIIHLKISHISDN